MDQCKVGTVSLSAQKKRETECSKKMKAMNYKNYFLTVLSASCMKASAFRNTLSTSFLPIISNSIHASSSHMLISSANEEVDVCETSISNSAYKYHPDPNDNMDQPIDIFTINHLL